MARAIRVKTDEGWQDVAVSGPPGPDGAQGPKGDPGTTGAAGPGVVSGGTTDQVLAKKSAADYDTKWVTPASGSSSGGEVYEQVSEPTTAGLGSIWIDTDAPVPTSGAISTYTKATRPVANSVPSGTMIVVSDEVVGKKVQISDGSFWNVLGSLAPDQTYPIGTFTYVSDGDTNGVIYYLGTRLGAFSAPVTAPAQGATAASGTDLTISSSSTFNDSTINLRNTVDRTAGTHWETNDSAGSWFQLDLITRKLKPTRYSLKTRADLSTFYLRSWVFEGSNDGSSWTAIDTKTNDTTQNSLGAWVSPAVSASTYYRYLRVRNTGTTSGSNNYLALAEIEVYGDLVGAT